MAIDRKPVILDAAMGTALTTLGMPPGVCPEAWILEHPDVAEAILRAFAAVGCEIVLAPTFGANRARLAPFGLAGQVREMNLALVKLTRAATGGKCKIAGDISPVGMMIKPLGEHTFDDLIAVYKEQISALDEAGADLFYIETMMSITEARAAVIAAREVNKNKQILCTFTCDEQGKTLYGHPVEAALIVLQGMGIDAFGLNCSTGPAEMCERLQALSPYARIPMISKPNAGVPTIIDGVANYDIAGRIFYRQLRPMYEAGVRYFGGCCGSTYSIVGTFSQFFDRYDLEELECNTPAKHEGDFLAAGTAVFGFAKDTPLPPPLIITADFEDQLFGLELEADDLLHLRLEAAENLPFFTDALPFLKNKIALSATTLPLLESLLKNYQGRALALSEEHNKSEVENLCTVYGALIK